MLSWVMRAVIGDAKWCQLNTLVVANVVPDEDKILRISIGKFYMYSLHMPPKYGPKSSATQMCFSFSSFSSPH